MRRLMAVSILMLSIGAIASDQPSTCRDIADEPNHQLLYQNDVVRIFQMDLPGTKATEEFCVAHPYLRVIATEGRVADLVAGEVAYGHGWKPGDARFIFQPKRKAIRNETGVFFREYVVETLRPVEFDARYESTADFDLLQGEPALTQNHVASAVRGSLTMSKAALGPGDQLLIDEGSHFVIALSPVDLTYGKDKQLTLEKGEAVRLPVNSAIQLKNGGTREARFITVDF